MAKNNLSAIDAAMNLVEKVIENLGKCKIGKNDSKKSKNKTDFYAPTEKEFNELLEEFDELTFKKFCKLRDLNKDKKKSLKKYCEYLTSFLPVVGVYTRFMASSTNKTDIEKEDNIVHQFISETYIDYIKELVNNDEDIPIGLEYYPLILATVNVDMKLHDDEVSRELPIGDMNKISVWASQKLITKLAKKFDCPVGMAMTIIESIPTRDAYSCYPNQWVRRNALITLINDLIECEDLENAISAKNIPDFSEIFNYMNIPINAVIPQVLATNKKESSVVLNALTDWALDELNDMSDDDMESIIKSYCFIASKLQNYEPRIIFSELPSEYIKLRNAATRILNNKKFSGKGFDKILK